MEFEASKGYSEFKASLGNTVRCLKGVLAGGGDPQKKARDDGLHQG